MRRTKLQAFICFLIPAIAHAADLRNPVVFASNKNGVLDITLIAREQVTSLGKFQAKTWVYEVCQRTGGYSNTCPPGAVASYGGVQLSLRGGDKLKIRLVNKLPPAPAEAKHAQGPGAAMLGGNPTNLHTHGLIVEPRRAGNGLATYGDYVFVLTYNSGNGPLPPAGEGMDVCKDVTDYEIDIPAKHPSGLFWFHPHAHGLALNQVSAGMAGIITIGDPADYLCDKPGCSGYSGKIPQRQMILKDTQILASGALETQQDTQFCASQPAAGNPPRNGFCPGKLQTGDTSPDPTGGQWFHTINGQVFPTIRVNTETGELWRIANTSGGNTYELGIADASGHDMTVQILSIDGVSIVTPSSGATPALLSAKIQTVRCPAGASEASANLSAPPACAQRIRMMPSSRIELWVTYRDAAGQIAAPPPGATAVLKKYYFNTGSAGDTWPEVLLAQVEFSRPPPKSLPPVTSLGVKGQAISDMLPGGIFATPGSLLAAGFSKPVPMAALEQLARKQISGSDARVPFLMGSNAAALEARNLTSANLTALGGKLAAVKDPMCKPLASGHARRIFFGVPADNADNFGLGYEELDEKGDPIKETFVDITEFDHAKVNVCLPLGPGNTEVTEHWELINVAAEDHNFHIHQTKFEVLTKNSQGAAQFDNVPVQVLRPQNDTCDGTIQKWRDKLCRPVPVEVMIPFKEIGDFVYHCHILEHEDGGMMARIRVVPN